MAEGEVRIKELEEVTTLTQNHYFVVDDSSSGGKSKKYLADKVTAPLDNALLNEASSYDTTHTYNEGDYCLKDNVLYRCLYDNVTGTWTASKWVQTSLGADLTENTNDTQQAFVEGTASGAIATFTDGSNLPMPSLTAYITALQDLHGYDYPWVGGAGKNKLPLTVDGIKAVNTYHSWSGNSTTINNVTITIETDSVGNVIGIKFNGTASADITFNLASNIVIPNGSYVLSNDQIVNISNLWLSLTSPNIAITLNSEKERNVIVSNGSIGSAYIYATSGNTFNNVVFKPMIRLASVSDSTWQPYSNECPIIGWSAVDVTDCGKNKFDLDAVTSFIKSGVVSTQGLTNQDGVITNSKSYGGDGIFPFNYPMTFGSNTITVSADIKLSGNHSSNNVFIQMYNSNGSGIIANGEVTMSSKDTWEHKTVTLQLSLLTNVNLAIEARGTNNSVQIKNVQVEIGSATDYEPYNGNTYSLTFTDGTNPLTVYGGYVDLVSGVLTVDRGYADLGTINWIYSENAQVFGSNQFTPYVLTNGKLQSLQYKWNSTPNVSPINLADGEISASPYFNRNTVMIKDSRYTSASDFKSAMNGVQLVYELATPLTYQLSKQQIRSLVGENNIFADTGAIKNVTYRRDNNTVINGLLNNIQFVTQAQYDALPSSKTSNGVLYFITG